MPGPPAGDFCRPIAGVILGCGALGGVAAGPPRPPGPGCRPRRGSLAVSRRTQAVIVLVWLAIVLPLSQLGYGSDLDAWLVAHNATRIWESGQYHVSRTTGFPLHELLVTPLVMLGGWHLSNLPSIAAGGLLLLSMFRLAGQGGIRHPVATILTLAFLPVVLTNATTTLDCLPATALLLFAFVLLVEGRWVLCAVLIGVACGFRPSSGLFVVPCIVWLLCGRHGRHRAVLLPVIAAAVGAAACTPVLVHGGFRGVSFSVDFDVRLMVAGYNATRVFGHLQSLLLLVILIAGLLRRSAQPRSDARTVVVFHVANVMTWLVVFLYIPVDADYLLPAVPSIVLLLDALVDRRLMRAAAVVALSANLIAFEPVQDIMTGFPRVAPRFAVGHLIADIQNRVFQLSTRYRASVATVRQPTLLLYGESWIPVVNDRWKPIDPEHHLWGRVDQELYVASYLMPEERLRRYYARGFRIVLWPRFALLLGGRVNKYRQFMQVIDSTDELETVLGGEIRGRPIW